MTLVTGAAGTLGSEICRQIGKCYAVDVNEIDLYRLSLEIPIIPMCDSITRPYFWNMLRDMDIDTVINCAAIKHIVTVEAHGAWAWLVNYNSLKDAKGPWKMVHVSTDKAVYPATRYGRTKQMAEALVLEQGGRVVRLVNIHNSRGCAEEIFSKQIERGGPVTARDSRMKRYFTTVEQAAVDVLYVAENAELGLYIPDAGEPVAIDDIIRDLIGFGQVEVVYTGIQKGEKFIEDLMWEDESIIPWSERISKVVKE